jgi:hemoglobin
MRNNISRWYPILVACTLFVAPAIPLPAEEKPAAAPVSTKVLHQQINDMLAVIINTGSEIHNGSKRMGIPRNTAGCYRLYHDFLLALRPLLSDQPDLQNAIDTGLTRAERMPAGTMRNYSEKAFVLRGVIDTIRDRVGPRKSTLWFRLGGEANVRKVVDDFVDLVAKDPKVNFFRGPAFKEKADVPRLKKWLLELISATTGGPYAYGEWPLKEVHISGAEFDALAADVAEALAKNGAQPADIDAINAMVAATRKNIVEDKPRPEEKKGGDKKPEEKKSPEKSD